MKQPSLIQIACAAFLLGVVAALPLPGPLLLEWLSVRCSPDVEALAAPNPVTKWSSVRNPNPMFVIVKRPRDELPTNYIPAERIENLKDRQLRKALPAGAIITYDDLLPAGRSGSVHGLQRGPFGIFLNLANEDAGIDLFIKPGYYVDLIYTSGDETSIVVENAKVMTIDSKRIADQSTVNVVLLVDRIAQVAKMQEARDGGGYFTLALRAPGDQPKEDRD